jgi:hypothetical protein
MQAGLFNETRANHNGRISPAVAYASGRAFLPFPFPSFFPQLLIQICYEFPNQAALTNFDKIVTNFL